VVSESPVCAAISAWEKSAAISGPISRITAWAGAGRLRQSILSSIAVIELGGRGSGGDGLGAERSALALSAVPETEEIDELEAEPLVEPGSKLQRLVVSRVTAAGIVFPLQDNNLAEQVRERLVVVARLEDPRRAPVEASLLGASGALAQHAAAERLDVFDQHCPVVVAERPDP
jgi:hypothetical protein